MSNLEGSNCLWATGHQKKDSEQAYVLVIGTRSRESLVRVALSDTLLLKLFRRSGGRGLAGEVFFDVQQVIARALHGAR